MSDEKALEGIEIGFMSGALPDADDIDLRGLIGREELSRLFEFKLLLSRPAPFTPGEINDLLHAPCAVAMGPKPADVVHGLLRDIELIDSTRDVAARYIATMVPTAWLLTQPQGCRIYQDATVPEIVEQILTSFGMSSGKHFDIRVAREKKSPTREYVVQYNESDWDFIQRWLEHEGFFYWFVHGSDGERLVIADENADATPIASPTVISYRERNNLSSGRLSTIWDWRHRQQRVGARVTLADYNYRTPGQILIVKEDADKERGFGNAMIYGEHFKDADVGQELAKIRAERVVCQKRVITGRTDCSRFRVGHTFELENHFDSAHDGSYLITAIEHHVGYPVEGTGDPQRYAATFKAIPLDVQYRPERATPWPHIHGIMSGHIDADSAGAVAQIDEQGRYRVKLPFDLSNKKGSTSSRWVRMAQPYSGAGYGMHHPLHKGAEVLIAHINGDPDRPIIVGTAPTPHTASPSVRANATQSVTHTHSGIRIEMEDQQN